MRGLETMNNPDMKGNVEMLVDIVDSYITELEHAVISLQSDSMLNGSLSISSKIRLSDIKLRLRYIKHQKDRALYIDVAAESSFLD